MEEYIKMLSEKLSKFDEETKNEILEDYREHFREARAQGIPDQQIIADLGDIDEMLADLVDSHPAAPISVPEVEENLMRPETVETCPAAGYNQITVNGTEKNSHIGYSAAVQIFPSQDGTIHAEYARKTIQENSPVFGITTESKNGVFEVNFVIMSMPESQPKGFLAKFFRNNFIGGKDTGTITVYVPQNFPALTVSNSSGGTSVQSISVGTLSVSCSSGAAACEKIKANEIAVSSSSGSSALSSASASKIEIQASSGSTCVQSCLADSFSVRTSSGCNVINNVTAAECSVVSSSGAANAEDIVSRNITITTSSGSSRLNCRAKNINAVSGSGSSNIHVDGRFGCINVKSGSGSIHLSGCDVVRSIHNIRHGSGNVSVQAVDGEKLSSMVNVSCGSGNISITE